MIPILGVLFTVMLKVKEKKSDDKKKAPNMIVLTLFLFWPLMAPGFISILSYCKNYELELPVFLSLAQQRFKEHLLCALFWAGNKV